MHTHRLPDEGVALALPANDGNVAGRGTQKALRAWRRTGRLLETPPTATSTPIGGTGFLHTPVDPPCESNACSISYVYDHFPSRPVAGVAPGRPGVTGLVAEAEASLAGAGGASVDGLDDEALGEVIAGLARVESRAVELRLALSAEADRRRVAEATAETGTDAWLARLTGTSRSQAAGGLRLARLLGEKYAATREAFAAGRVGVDQVRVILSAAEQAPAEATPGQLRLAEQWLVDQATGAGTRTGRSLDAKRLRQAARRMFARIDPELASRHEAILLGRETRSAEAETFLALHDNGDGSYTGRFRIPELHGHLLTQVLDRLTAPRRLTHDRSGTALVDESAPGHDGGMNAYERYGAALCELIERLPTQGWTGPGDHGHGGNGHGGNGHGGNGHGGNGCEILVRIELEALLTGLGTAGLDTGVAITAGEARRPWPATPAWSPPSSTATPCPWTSAGRDACTPAPNAAPLALLHDTCAITGCQRPFAWCEIHHPHLSWGHGGATDLHNGLPLCGHHHRRAHDPTFTLHHHPDGPWTLHRRT